MIMTTYRETPHKVYLVNPCQQPSSQDLQCVVNSVKRHDTTLTTVREYSMHERHRRQQTLCHI